LGFTATAGHNVDRHHVIVNNIDNITIFFLKKYQGKKLHQKNIQFRFREVLLQSVKGLNVKKYIKHSRQKRPCKKTFYKKFRTPNALAQKSLHNIVQKLNLQTKTFKNIQQQNVQSL
jgi:ribosomal protein L14E/L6E/L27E